MKNILEGTTEETSDFAKSQNRIRTADECIVDYHQRCGVDVPTGIKETPYVLKDDLMNALEQLQRLACVSSKIRNMKLSELVYITNQASVRNPRV